VANRLQLDVRSLGLNFRPPAHAGVLPDGRNWVWFIALFGTPKLVWTEMGSSISTPLDIPLEAARLLAVDPDAVAYICGRSIPRPDEFAQLRCQACGPMGGRPGRSRSCASWICTGGAAAPHQRRRAGG
jgi:hypothetical protein